MREQITRDFQAIQNLTADVRLIDDSLPPTVYGKKGTQIRYVTGGDVTQID